MKTDKVNRSILGNWNTLNLLLYGFYITLYI